MSLRTKKGRKEAKDMASKKFQMRLSEDLRYELVNGVYQLKQEELIRVCKSNLDFFLRIKSNDNFTQENINRGTLNAMKNLIESMTWKILRDYGI